jgi:hypothetical protein
MLINKITLAELIREEQETCSRPYNTDKYTTDTYTLKKDGIKLYSYDSRLEHTQGLNSNKSSKPIFKKIKKSINQSFLKLRNDDQLCWFNGKYIRNKCSYYLEFDDRFSTIYDFYVTITPPFESKNTEQDLLNLTKISFRQAQYYINPDNRHKLRDKTTLPQVTINVCKEAYTYTNLHIIIYDTSIRDFLVLLYHLYHIFRANYSNADIEYHNLISTEHTEIYTDKQVVRTLFTADIFGL